MYSVHTSSQRNVGGGLGDCGLGICSGIDRVRPSHRAIPASKVAFALACADIPGLTIARYRLLTLVVDPHRDECGARGAICRS